MTLQFQWLSCVPTFQFSDQRALTVAFCVLMSALHSGPQFVQAADPPSAVGSMLTLLKSGRVPEQRLGTIVKLICDRGNEHDLRYVFDQVVDGDWPTELKIDALTQLQNASSTRNVKPAGELTSIEKLLKSEVPTIQSLAIRLSGQWKLEGVYDALFQMSSSPSASAELKTTIISAMAKISPEKTKSLLIKLATESQNFSERSTAINTLTKVDITAAAALAAKTLATADVRESPAAILDGFLEQEGGSRILADAVSKSNISGDMAKLALRHMYSIGRTDQELSSILSEKAGIAGDPKIPTPEELAALVKEVNTSGDAQRGESVFRRSDLSCMKCHAVSKAGGQIGPDLSAIGASSPVEYVVMSVLDPDQAIKEAYTTRVVITLEGRIHQGIVVDRTANALVLKDATGKATSVPIDDIDEEVEGKSLMPKGLVKFMTHAEFIDLAKFLATLGKPGEFAVRTTQRTQRWKLLKDVPQNLIDEVPSLTNFEDLVLRATLWQAVYGKVGGELPLDELVAVVMQPVLYVQGELNVQKGGPVQVKLNSAEGLTVWFDENQVEAQESFVVDLPAGIHPVTFRIDTSQRGEKPLKLEFFKPEGSNAEFSVVDGE